MHYHTAHTVLFFISLQSASSMLSTLLHLPYLSIYNSTPVNIRHLHFKHTIFHTKFLETLSIRVIYTLYSIVLPCLLNSHLILLALIFS